MTCFLDYDAASKGTSRQSEFPDSFGSVSHPTLSPGQEPKETLLRQFRNLINSIIWPFTAVLRWVWRVIWFVAVKTPQNLINGFIWRFPAVLRWVWQVIWIVAVKTPQNLFNGFIWRFTAVLRWVWRIIWIVAVKTPQNLFNGFIWRFPVVLRWVWWVIWIVAVKTPQNLFNGFIWRFTAVLRWVVETAWVEVPPEKAIIGQVGRLLEWVIRKLPEIGSGDPTTFSGIPDDSRSLAIAFLDFLSQVFL
jgi:hypothetical protein